MPKSTYLANKILDHATGRATFTKPTNTYVALYTSNPTFADTGTEVSGGSYARQVTSWATAATSSIATNAQVQFTGLPTATITHWGLRDAASGGNLLYFDAFTQPIVANAENNPSLTLQSGNFTITEG